MIITSNSVTHSYTIPSLVTMGQVDDNLKVIEKVTVQIDSSISFDHTYDMDVVNFETNEVTTTSVTKNKTINETRNYDVNLDTAGISTFVGFNDLQEDQVLQWAFDKDSSTKSLVQGEQETLVLEKKDMVLNPLKYQRDYPTCPWLE